MIKKETLFLCAVGASLGLSSASLGISVNVNANQPKEPTSEAYHMARKRVVKYLDLTTDENLHFVRTIAEKEKSAVWQFALWGKYDHYPSGYYASADWSGDTILTEVWRMV